MDSRMISYLYFFNIRKDYYECHEYGESLWLEMGRPAILKGLIQAAVCLYHLQNGNVKGGLAMWQRAKQYVRDGRPVYQSIHLDRLVSDIDAVFSRVPASWYDKVVPAKEIEALGLSTVEIEICDESLRQLLPQWEPEPLDED